MGFNINTAATTRMPITPIPANPPRTSTKGCIPFLAGTGVIGGIAGAFSATSVFFGREPELIRVASDVTTLGLGGSVFSPRMIVLIAVAISPAVEKR